MSLFNNFNLGLINNQPSLRMVEYKETCESAGIEYTIEMYDTYSELLFIHKDIICTERTILLRISRRNRDIHICTAENKYIAIIRKNNKMEFCVGSENIVNRFLNDKDDTILDKLFVNDINNIFRDFIDHIKSLKLKDIIVCDKTIIISNKFEEFEENEEFILNKLIERIPRIQNNP
mgnify:CR=1 FL=1